MSRAKKIALWIGCAIIAQALIALIVAILILQTDWFRTVVRQKIVTAVEQGTGGRVEAGHFHFAWTHLRAELRNIVIHGLEPPGAEPLFRANLVRMDFTLLSPFKGFMDIRSLLVDTPRANIMILDNGRTNIPTPKVEAKSGKTTLAVVVDLAIRHFELRNGTATFSDRKRPLNLKAEDLRAQLAYDRQHARYTGEIDMTPLLVNGLRTNVKLPVTLERDRIAFQNALVTTPRSRATITGAVENMRAPRFNAHVNARIAVEEMKQMAALRMPLDTVHGPGVLNADVTLSTDGKGGVNVRSARVTLGHSSLEASGAMNQARFQASLSLSELGRLFEIAQQPEGTLRFAGNGSYAGGTNFHVRGSLEAYDVGFRQGGARIAGAQLASAVEVDPHRIALAGLRISALGGSFSGDAVLEDMDRYRVRGSVNRFDVDTMLRAFAQTHLGYDGILSGPVNVEGSIKASAAVVARASLTVAPGPHGIPVSGRLNVEYNGREDTVAIARSYLELPHTRIDLEGSLGQRIAVKLVSRDLSDFRPIAPKLPLTIEPGGAATVTATINGKLRAPHIAGQVLLTNFSAEGHPFTRLSGDVDASASGISVSNGLLARGALQANFSGSLALRNWRTDRALPVRVDATVHNADVQDVLALTGQSYVVPVSGMLAANVHIEGPLGNPVGNADVNITNGTVEGERFDSMLLRVAMTSGMVSVPSFVLTAGPSRIEGNGEYRHAPGDWVNGDWRVHVASNAVQLSQFATLVKTRPGLRGVVTLTADATGHGTNLPDAVQTLNANLSAHNVEMDGAHLGDLTATAQTAGQQIRYNVTSDYAGSTIRVNGQTLLTGNHDTSATATVANLPVDRVLALLGRRDIPVTGKLDANAQVSGTLYDPRVTATLSLTGGKAYEQPFTKVQGSVQYARQTLTVNSLRAEVAGATIDANTTLANRYVQFRIRSTPIELANLHVVQQVRPGMTGTLEIAGEGSGPLSPAGVPLFTTLRLNAAAHGVAVDNTPLGDVTLTATTQGGQVMLALRSNLAGSEIQGSGKMQLTNGYPVEAKIIFNRLTYSGLRPLLHAPQGKLEGTVNGEFSFAGPAARPEELRGILQLNTLEAHSVSTKPNPRTMFRLSNQGPLVAVLEGGVLKVQSGRIAGPHTTFNVGGTVSLVEPRGADLRVDADLDLESLEALEPTLFASGKAVLSVTITGNLLKPAVTGRMVLQSAAFNLVDLPNGISNASGTILFNGNEATIQNITGETGGGKVVLSGFVIYGGPELQFRLLATATGVRISAPAGVSTQVDARLTLVGTSSSSVLSGTVTVQDVVLYSHADIGSLLTSAGRPAITPPVSTGLLASIRYDVRIHTAPEVEVRTSLTQNVQIEANLTLRGGVDHPGLLGRVRVTQGEVVFFGTRYTIDQGTVSFFDPNRINPILMIDLSTTVQGIEITLSVAGPVDRMKFSYRSEPPLQFNEIVSLLASGRIVSTDPVLAAREPAVPQPPFPQAGAAAIVGQAISAPVSGRLQRIFGVTRLRIDPQVAGIYNTTTAAFTVQQQITKDITFTYTQDVNQTNPLIIRVEWFINRQWSAVLFRDQNGQIDLDVYFKKRFR